MIGRNDINQAALLGSTAPHENSADLVAVAKRANEEGTKFDLDKLWDKPEHPEYWYFRSITFLMLVEAFLRYSLLVYYIVNTIHQWMKPRI
jgi:hypothetical protein